jgi:hypothetical protein
LWIPHKLDGGPGACVCIGDNILEALHFPSIRSIYVSGKLSFANIIFLFPNSHSTLPGWNKNLKSLSKAQQGWPSREPVWSCLLGKGEGLSAVQITVIQLPPFRNASWLLVLAVHLGITSIHLSWSRLW